VAAEHKPDTLVANLLGEIWVVAEEKCGVTLFSKREVEALFIVPKVAHAANAEDIPAAAQVDPRICQVANAHGSHYLVRNFCRASVVVVVSKHTEDAEWSAKFCKFPKTRSDPSFSAMNKIACEGNEVRPQCIGEADRLRDHFEGHMWPVVEVGKEGNAQSFEGSGQTSHAHMLAIDPA